jgi:hypothetical protein
MTVADFFRYLMAYEPSEGLAVERLELYVHRVEVQPRQLAGTR